MIAKSLVSSLLVAKQTRGRTRVVCRVLLGEWKSAKPVAWIYATWERCQPRFFACASQRLRHAARVSAGPMRLWNHGSVLYRQVDSFRHRHRGTLGWPVSGRPPTESYHPTFARWSQTYSESRPCSSIQRSRQSREWRVVSPAVPNYRDAEIRYRSGRTTLLPYVDFQVSAEREKAARIAHIFLGPNAEQQSGNALVIHVLESGASGGRRVASTPRAFLTVKPDLSIERTWSLLRFD